MKAEITEDMQHKNEPFPGAPEEAPEEGLETDAEIGSGESEADVSGNEVVVVNVDPDGQILTYLDEIYRLFEVTNERVETIESKVEEINARSETLSEYRLFDKPLSEYTPLEGMTALSVIFILTIAIWKVYETFRWRR